MHFKPGPSKLNRAEITRDCDRATFDAEVDLKYELINAELLLAAYVKLQSNSEGDFVVGK